MGELDIDFGIDFLTVGLEPGSLGAEDLVDGAHALLEGDAGDAQVLTGLGEVSLGGLKGLEGLL